MGKHGEQGKHRKKGKHQPDDLKHSTYDSKHSISHQNTLSVNKITQNTLFLMAPFENNITADN